MPIQYLSYRQINKEKWDSCIDNSSNGRIYAYSIYLDTMAARWDALVMDDYKVVMPLTWNKKYGICYLYQPFITACLGVFGNGITADTVNDFLGAIPKKFRYWDIYLNSGNRFYLKQFKFYDRVNYVLPLREPYPDLYARFRIGLRQSIKRAGQLNCMIRRDIHVDDVIALAEEQGRNFSSASTKDYERLKRLYHALFAKEQACSYGIYLASGQLVASCLLFFSHKRVYYILAGNHPNGRAVGASQMLINAFIEDHAGKDLLLDFEGSDIPSLAFFYSSFGSTAELYVGLKENKLPKIVQLFKS